MSLFKRIARTHSVGFTFLALLLLFSLFASVSLGSVTIPFKDTLRVLFSRTLGGTAPGVPESSRTIISRIRVPRVLLGMLVGASLSLSGLVFQALLRNPLADPYTLGISAGAAFGAGFAVFLSHLAGAYFQTLLPLFAFSGGVSTVFLVYFLARMKGRVQILTIILGGVVVSYLFSAGLVLFMSLLGDRAHEIIYWLMGNLSGYHPFLHWNAAVMVFLMLLSAYFTRDLDLLTLGDEQAKSLGVNIELVRLLLFSSTSLLTSLSVSMTGTIGFVGLIVPHSMRLLFGPQHRTLVPASVIAGAAFLPLSDTLARTLPDLLFGSGMEIPVGVLTSLLGAPFFIILLIRGKSRSWF
jgi:iron complex transport system permease protein